MSYTDSIHSDEGENKVDSIEPGRIVNSGYAEDISKGRIDKSPVHSLVQDVADQMRLAFEVSISNDVDFLPNDKLRHIINLGVVSSLLCNTFLDIDESTIAKLTENVLGRDYIERGRQNPPRQKIFAILVMMDKIAFIEDFIRNNVQDDDLPLKIKRQRSGRKYDLKLCWRRPTLNDDSSQPNQDLEPLELSASWSYNNMEDFESRQKTFCVPIFQLSCEGNNFYSLTERPVLPFVEMSIIDVGGYGTVRKVKIHEAHYRHIDGCKIKDDPTTMFAVKELHSEEKNAYLEEMEAIKTFGIRTHGQGSDHLIKLEFSYLYGHRYHLVFPWADGNLREFWQLSDSFGTRNKHDIIWFLNQCKGLAGGLQRIHIPDATPNASEAAPRRWGRHGDIKPENILWFGCYEGMKNHMVISDFGLAKFHTSYNESGEHADAIAGYSGTYRAPEIDLNEDIAQSYDIWSLGCIFLEFISWFILGDAETHTSFTSRRVEDDEKFEPGRSIMEDKFFILEKSEKLSFELQASLKPAVDNVSQQSFAQTRPWKAHNIKWITKLQGHETCTRELRAFLTFIKQEMLRPSPKERANCERVMTEMTGLMRMCRLESRAINDAHDQDERPAISDSGSDTSYAASVWSNLSELTSASSVIPDSDISEELARVLLRDEQIRDLLVAALQSYDDNVFVQKTNRIIMKFLVDMRRDTSSQLYLRILRTLAKLERRRQVTNSIIRILGLGDEREIKAQNHDIDDRVGRLQDGLREIDSRFSDKKAWHTGVTADPQALLGFSDESDNDSQDSHAEVAEKDAVSLEEVEDYISSGRPFLTLKARLEYLANPPKTVSEALTAEGCGLLAVLLEKRFLQIARGEYDWLVDLKEMGYSYAEMADLLYQASHDSPWIYFESKLSHTSSLTSDVPKDDRHVQGCIHSILRETEGLRFDSEISTLQNDENEIKRQIEELCGLCGITPSSRDDTEWIGSVEFHTDQEPPMVTISHSVPHDGVDDIQGPCLRVLRIVKGLQTAAVLMQDAGFCCQSFTVLVTTEVGAKSKAPKVSLRHFEFSVLGEIAEGIKKLQRCVDEVDLIVDLIKHLSGLRILSKFILGDLLEAPDISKCSTKTEVLQTIMQLIYLSVQVLGLGLMLYFQAHTGDLQPFFLDTPLREVHLVGLNSPNSTVGKSNPGIKVHLTQLTCLHDMVGDKVMVFYPSTTEFPPGTRFDLDAKIEDVLDTWGPGQIVFQNQNRSLPVAVRIGGGFISRIHNDDSGTYHWERKLQLPDNPFTLNLDRAVIIGALITTNSSCKNDESVCWQSSFDMGQMCIVGTHDPHMATSSHEFGIQLGYEGALMTYTRVRQKQPGITAKEKLFGSGPLRSNSLLGILDHFWAVRMSYCTGVAQRVCLRHMIGDLFPVFAETCNTMEDSRIWNSLKGHVAERFNGSAADRQSLKCWLQDLDKDSHNFVLWISNMILNHLMHTGITPDGKCFQVAWPHDGRLHLGIQVPINNDFTKWVPILAESKECATFAYVQNVCLATSNISCGGLHPDLEKRLLLLETAVMSHATKIPPQWALCHQKDYFFLMEKSLCWVTVEKDASKTAAPATLIRRHRLERLGHTMKSRVMEFKHHGEQRIREANLPSSRAETVHIVSRKVA